MRKDYEMKYYLPDSYPDTAKGARFYIKDIKSSDKEKEEKKLTIKAVKLIIDYNKNEYTQPLIDALEEEDDDYGAMLFSIDLWGRFITGVRNEVVKEKKERKARIESSKRSKKTSKNKGDYHYHKDKKTLQNAIRNESELFKTEIFRNFVADVNDGTYKPTQKYISKETERKHMCVIANIEYYKNMGFPLCYESSKIHKFNACQLTADRLGISKYSAEDIYKKKDRLGGSTALAWRTGFNDWDDWLYTWHGSAIWVLNGFRRPETMKEIEQLEKLFMSLPKEDHNKIESFSRGYNARKTKLPTTKKELKRIKKILSNREHYDLVKSLQIRQISIKT